MKFSPSILKILLVCSTWLSCLLAFGQSPSDLALKNIQKQKWQRARYLLSKAVAKDSLNVTAKYVLAQYFFSKANPAYHLDSAHLAIKEALVDFQRTTVKQRDRLKRFPVDSILLIKFQDRIDSTAFRRAKDLNSEDSFIAFLRSFPKSPRRSLAVDARDSIAFSNALKKNTLDAFQLFLNTYPEAKQEKIARDAYEKLLFEQHTLDEKLESYQSFVRDFPRSPFRKRAEKVIFEYCTADGSIEAFRTYIQKHPQSPFVKKATDILFHLIPEADRSSFIQPDFSNDSLDAVIRLTDKYLVPFLENQKFGFMDVGGRDIIAAEVDSIDARYLCGNIADDFILLPNKIVSNNGAVLQRGKFTEVEDLGYGFLLISQDNCSFLIHKTGFRVGADCVDDAKIIAGKFVACRQGTQWSVWTLTGRLLANGLEAVFWIKDVIVAKVHGSYKLIRGSQLSQLPRQSVFDDTTRYDEVRPWPTDLILVRRNDSFGILDQLLHPVVPLADQALRRALSCIVVSTAGNESIYRPDGEKCPIQFQQIVANDKWIVGKLDGAWRFYDPEINTVSPLAYDTIAFQGPFAIGHRSDSSIVYFSQNIFSRWRDVVSAEFTPGQDSLSFITITQKGRKTIYNQLGERLFSTSAEKIQHVGCGLFVIHQNDKKGLVSQQGKQILPAEYEAMGSPNNGMISLLKSGKFGLYDCEKNRLIKPAYDKNITPYNASYLIAYKDGLYGFLNWSTQKPGRFEFNEVRYWNDTSALVRKNSQWMIYDFQSKAILMDKIADFKIIQDMPFQKIAIIHKEDSYGVLHSKNGVILPLSFSYIINVGSTEEPMYFTEKHVKEALIFVVMYYNTEGKMVRKEIYDQNEYDDIYCDRN